MTTAVTAPPPCAYCGKLADGAAYVLADGSGQTFRACSSRHAQAYRRAQSKPAYLQVTRSSATRRKWTKIALPRARVYARDARRVPRLAGVVR